MSKDAMLKVAMLKVEGLQTSYGQSQVLFDIGFEINRGEVVTLLGRNGMGKTTTVRSIMGMTAPHGGTVTFHGEAIRGLSPFAIARRGLGLVPEGRAIFANLTVWENLTATARARRRALDHGQNCGNVPMDRPTPPPDGGRAVGRRAADAGDCPGAHDQPRAANP